MAEILISLTIIGVIAAITLPSLQANINEKTWATQRKALYSRMSQAIGMMPSLNGYGVVFEDGSINETATANKATQAFITDGLSKVLKISNVCDGSTADGLKKCGFPDKIRKQGPKAPIMNTPKKISDLNYYYNVASTNIVYSQILTKNSVFETLNGESVLVSYNPNCSYTYGINGANNAQNLMQPTMCANFIYDLNGRKGPNQVGKDIGFMTAFYPTDSEVLMPIPVKLIYNLSESQYPVFNISTGNLACRDKFGKDTKMANIEELKSIFVNDYLGHTTSSNSNFLNGTNYSSSTMSLSNEIYALHYQGAISTRQLSSAFRTIFCIKR